MRSYLTGVASGGKFIGGSDWKVERLAGVEFVEPVTERAGNGVFAEVVIDGVDNGMGADVMSAARHG